MWIVSFAIAVCILILVFIGLGVLSDYLIDRKLSKMINWRRYVNSGGKN